MPKWSSRPESGGFSCVRCRTPVPGQAPGTNHRNHCPACLWSRHVDDRIGDRRSPCAGPMEPIAMAAKDDGEWCIIHRCTQCGQLRTNRIAGDDDERSLLRLAIRPLAFPAFPLDSFRGSGV